MTFKQRWLLSAAVLGSAIVFLDGTVVNVALPRIGRELPSHILGTLEGQAYVYNGYLLTLGSLLILAGALGDRYGRRLMFGAGLAGFGLASLLCGLAPSLEALVAFRVLQGVTGALLVPGSLALINTAFEGEQRARAFGIWTAATSATTLLGPLIGGVLVDSVSWRAVFILNVPLVVVALYATAVHLEESKSPAGGTSFDWAGALLVALACGGLSFGAIYGQQRQWSDPVAYAALAVGAVSTLLLPFWFRRARSPLVPLQLFGYRNFAITNVSTLIVYGALYVSFYYLPLYIQGILGYSAAGAGLAMLPSSLLLTLLSARMGALGARFGPRLFLAAGPALMGVGVLWFARLPAGSRPWRLAVGEPATFLPPADYAIDLLPGIILFGVGLTLLVAPLTATIMGSVPVANSGVASAVNNAISRIGPQLAGALIFVAVTSLFYADLAGRLPGVDTGAAALRVRLSPLNPPRGVPALQAAAATQASTDAFHLAMVACALMLIAGGVVNGMGIRRIRQNVDS